MVPTSGEPLMPGAKHLNALTIRGFRGIEHADFEKLGQFNVIVGKNDVGKTSVLEAVFLATGFTVPLLPIAIQNLRTHLVADPSDLSLLFHELDADSPIELVASTPGDTRTLTISLEPADLVVDQDVRSDHIGSMPEVPLLLRYRAKLVPRNSGEHLA